MKPSACPLEVGLYAEALIRLTDAGAKNFMLMTLPDATKAPQFKYSTQEEIETIRAKV